MTEDHEGPKVYGCHVCMRDFCYNCISTHHAGVHVDCPKEKEPVLS